MVLIMYAHIEVYSG